MPLEIERKFLVRSPAWRNAAHRQERMRQGYFATSERASIRVRVAGDRAWLNLKARRSGTTRLEYEYPIPVADAEEMLYQLCERPTVDKVRHWVRDGDHVFEVDEFLGANAGLVIAELELGAEDESCPHPAWLGEEVTDDERYYNFNLARHPWRQWGDGSAGR